MPDWLGPFLVGLAVGAMVSWDLRGRLVKDRLTMHARRGAGGLVRWRLYFGRTLIAFGSKDVVEARKKRIEEAIDGHLPEGR